MLLDLMIMAAKVGLTAFGGGLATISIYSYELVKIRGWLTPDEFTQMVAVCQSFPGPVAVNIATYIGYTMYGILGAVVTTTTVIAAPLCVLASVLWLFNNSTGKIKLWVTRVQKALRPSVGALLFISLVALIKPLTTRTLAWPFLLLSAVLIAFVPFVRKNPQIVLILSALGALFFRDYLTF